MGHILYSLRVYVGIISGRDFERSAHFLPNILKFAKCMGGKNLIEKCKDFTKISIAPVSGVST